MNVAALFALGTLLAAVPQQPSAGPGLNLREAVAYALDHSPALKLSEEEVQRRDGLAATALSPLLPQLDVFGDASLTRFDRGYPAAAVPTELRFDTAMYSAGLDLKLLVWDFGKTALELGAARERVKAARMDVDRRRQEIVFETARLYLQAMAFTDLMDAAHSRIESLRAFLDRTVKLVEGGRAVPVDVLKIKSRLAQVESDLATLESGRRSSLSGLAAVMGYEDELPQLAYSPAPSGAPSPGMTESELLHQAGTGRPELLAQDREVRAAERLATAARRSVLPRIDLRAAVIQYGSDSPVGFGQIIGELLPMLPIDPPSPGRGVTDWMIGLRISFSLFDGGRRNGQIEAAKAQLEEIRMARRQLRLRVDREVRTALADLESAQKRVEALRDSVTESERVLHDETSKYESGRSVINFVLDAEASLLLHQSLLSQAERSLATASLALDLSLGRIDTGRLPE